MAHTPNSPATLIRHAVAGILRDEFSTEQLEVRESRLHESEGFQGHVAGTYPEAIEEWSNARVGLTTIIVQVYRYWDEEDGTNEHSGVDPADIEAWADRFQQAVDDASGGSPEGTDELWYYRVVRINFPDDPTGNKTRFEAVVQGYGDNRALPETA